MSEASANDVKILVKNVYVPSETQQFVVVDSLCVRTLKQMLAAALPGNPPPKDQKLIFGGKICDDDDTLAKVLTGQNKDTSGSADAASAENSAPFVFHLMVSSSVPRSRPTTPTRPVAQSQPTAEQQLPTVAAPMPTTAATREEAIPIPTQPSPAAATDETIPATVPHVAPGFPFTGFFGAAPATAAPPLHHGTHHQLYTQAILMQQQAMVLSQIQYLQQLQAHNATTAHASSAAPTAAAVAPPPAHGMFPQYGHFGQHVAHGYGMPPHIPAYGHHAQAAHVPGIPAPPAELPAVVDARERGPIALAFREILPLFDIRLAMKMTFMLFIIGQDTPTDRLIVLALMSFGAYLHITGIIGKVLEILKRMRGVQEGTDDATDAPGANANPNNAQHARGRLGAIARYLQISADRGLVHDVRYFITGLLLSLVPAWHPQPLNADPVRPEPAMADAAPEFPLQGI